MSAQLLSKKEILYAKNIPINKLIKIIARGSAYVIHLVLNLIYHYCSYTRSPATVDVVGQSHTCTILHTHVC